jgi:hypothetical protein
VESDPIGLQGGSYSTYAYVEGNPVGNVDPRGLIKWRGTGTAISVIYGGGATRMTFDLTSECVNHQRAHVHVLAGGFAVGFGLTATGGLGDLEFEDGNSTIDPYVFEGTAKFVSAGFTVGGVPPDSVRNTPGRVPSPYEGLSIEFSALQLGGATSIGLGQMLGIDASVGGGAGISMVQGVTDEECCN